MEIIKLHLLAACTWHLHVALLMCQQHYSPLLLFMVPREVGSTGLSLSFTEEDGAQQGRGLPGALAQVVISQHYPVLHYLPPS